VIVVVVEVAKEEEKKLDQGSKQTNEKYGRESGLHKGRNQRIYAVFHTAPLRNGSGWHSAGNAQQVRTEYSPFH
jgi:hypothetical protein